MKTIKIMLIAVLLTGFSSRAVDGQARVIKGTVQYCGYNDCAGDEICAEISYKDVNNKSMGMWNEKSNFIGQ